MELPSAGKCGPCCPGTGCCPALAVGRAQPRIKGDEMSSGAREGAKSQGERKAKGEAAAEPRGASLSSLVSTQMFLQGARPRQGLCPPVLAQSRAATARPILSTDGKHGKGHPCSGPASSGKAVSTGKRSELSPNKTSGLRTVPAGIQGGFVPQTHGTRTRGEEGTRSRDGGGRGQALLARTSRRSSTPEQKFFHPQN